MAENKAIKRLSLSPLLKGMPRAIEDMEELEQYRAIGTVEECRKATEKQKAKKLIDDTAFGTCSNCHNEFNSELIHEYDMKYCIYCGQAIDRGNPAAADMEGKWLKWENGKEWGEIECPMLDNKKVMTYYPEKGSCYYIYTAPFVDDGEICYCRYDHDEGLWDDVLYCIGEYIDGVILKL